MTGAALIFDAATEGGRIILGMLIVGCIFLGTIALGELTRYANHRRHARRRARRASY